MTRVRRVSNILSFVPPTWLEGIAQVIDLYGNVPMHCQSPKIRYVKRKSSAKAKHREAPQEGSINAAIARDIKAIGLDMRVCIDRHASKIR